MVIDAFKFARLGLNGERVITGQGQIADFLRLCQDQPGHQNGLVKWQLDGNYDDNTGFAWLHIQAQGDIMLGCQRCLKPFSHQLNVDNSLRLLADESELELLEKLESDGVGVDYEYIVGGQHFDVMQLLEDELILVLPFAPKHDVCPSLDDTELLDKLAKPSPFAVLEQLKKH